jgi:hypothetical protein
MDSMLVSKSYEIAQKELAQNETFIEMMEELGVYKVMSELLLHRREFNHAISNEYHDRNGSAKAYGYGDYAKAAELWIFFLRPSWERNAALDSTTPQ